MTSQNCYPPSPQNIPANFLAEQPSYRRRAYWVFFSIFLFLFAYLGLIIATGYSLYRGFDWLPYGDVGGKGFIALVLFHATGLVILAFMLKFLLKRHHTDRSSLVELTEKDQPELFDFIRKVCNETGAPFPKHIYLSPEVNACVFYDSTVLSLFFPVQKNLLIGLGLINTLNLTEFKAVIAHEFGHFSQRAMKLGSYVYVANRIIVDMVYERDSFDEFLAQWKRTDIRLAAFGWVVGAVVWLIRQMLKGLYKIVNLAQASLSREMEYNADLYAVSLTGSDAIGHALLKLEYAETAFSAAMQYIYLASQHNLYSENIFYHQSQAVGKVKLNDYPELTAASDALVEKRGANFRLFKPTERHALAMWASHPYNHEREENAKKTYIESTIDTRSCWLLFRQPERLQTEVTRRFYTAAYGEDKKRQYKPAPEVQSFINDEQAELELIVPNGEFYQGRIIKPFEYDKITSELAPKPPQLLDLLANCYTLQHRELFEEWQKTEIAKNTLESAMQQTDQKVKNLTVGDVVYTKESARAKLSELEKSVETIENQLHDYDKRVFTVAYGMAAHLPENKQQLLVEYYAFLFEYYQGLMGCMSVLQKMQNIAHRLSDIEDADDPKLKTLRNESTTAYNEFVRIVKTANKLKLPPLKNVESIDKLGSFLVKNGLPTAPGENFYEKWLGTFYEKVNDYWDNGGRFYWKTIGSLLQFQANIYEQFKEKYGAEEQNS